MGFAYPIDSKVVTNPNGTIDYDRASNSTQLRGLIKSMITNGVNLTESTNLQVMADEETMNLTVKPGYVVIEGAIKHFEEDVKVTIGAADTTNPRIDTVVARLNLNEDVRDIVIDVLQGTPAAEPTAPELTRTTSYYEVGLADVLVELGATQISQAVVTDTRLLNSRCGMISAIGEIDTETLFNQLTTDFDNWFESIKGKLGDDVAGGLQLQINDHTTATVASEKGLHGLRYNGNVLEVYNKENNEWGGSGAYLPPRPVSNINANLDNFKNGINKLKASWTLPEVYDVQIDRINLYGCVGDDEPTSFSQFTNFAYVGKDVSSVDIEVNEIYDYIIVATVSTDGVVQKDLIQMCKTNQVLGLPNEGTTFADMTWEDIVFVSENNRARDYFNVGDVKSVEISGANYNVAIYDFDHDDKADGTGKAGLTIGLVNCLKTPYAMNNNDTNVGGWKSCELRKTLRDTIYYTLPEELRNGIKNVSKLSGTGGGNTNVSTGTDNLFLFSFAEIGVSGNAPSGEGTKYELFTDVSFRNKKLGDDGSSGARWFTRSPYTGNSSYFCDISSSSGTPGQQHANYSGGICFGFCI
jgi:hypothetical protein